MCTMYIPDVQRGQEDVWDLLELELQMFVSFVLGQGLAI